MKKTIILLLCLFAGATIQIAGAKWPKQAPKHVVIIGLDGLSSESLREGNPMPFLRTLMDKGTWAFHKRSVLPSSSALNWASLYMGAGPEQHGYNTWSSRKPDFPSDTLTNHGFFPDLYYQTKQTYPNAKIGHFYEWDGLHFVVDTLSIDKEQQIDHHKGELTVALTYFKTEQPLITSIIIDSPDHEGHTSGWLSPEYMAALKHLDDVVREIYTAVEQTGLLNETLFVITADHGGTDKEHGGFTMSELEAPVVFYGKGITPRGEIKETVSIMDITPTLAQILKLQRPHAWRGQPLPTVVCKK